MRSRASARVALLGLTLFLGCAPALPADLTIAGDSEPETLDPARMTGVGEGRIANALFEGLTRLDPGRLAPVPAAAETWEVSDDGLAWTFHLRDGLRWSDGNPLTSRDFRYSWLRLLDPETAADYANLLDAVRGAADYRKGEGPREAVGLEAPDDRTFVVRLEHPVPWFGALAAFFSLLPVPRQAIEAHGDLWTREGNLVGNGPYVLARHRFYRELVLERSPTWRDRGTVALRRVRIVPVPDPNTQLNFFLTGQADLTFSVPSSVVGALRDRPGYVSGPRLATAFLRLNVTRPALADARVRRAIALAVDRERLVDRVTRGGELPAGALVPPVLPDYRSPDGLRFDPEAARELLRAAGHPGGDGLPVLTLLLSQNPDRAAVAVVLQEELRRELGIEVRLDVREWNVYLQSMKSLDYDLALSQWIGDYPDPTTFLDCFAAGSGNNRTGWANPGYDGLLEAAATPAPGEREPAFRRRRLATLRRAESLLLESAPIVTLYHPTVRFLVSPAVEGFVPNVMGLVYFRDLSKPDRGR